MRLLKVVVVSRPPLLIEAALGAARLGLTRLEEEEEKEEGGLSPPELATASSLRKALRDNTSCPRLRMVLLLCPAARRRLMIHQWLRVKGSPSTSHSRADLAEPSTLKRARGSLPSWSHAIFNGPQVGSRSSSLRPRSIGIVTCQCRGAAAKVSK